MILTDKNYTERTMKKSLFTKRKTVILFAIIAMFSWGCAFPFIKLGMKEYAISKDDTAGKMLFAGIRFFLAGIITLIITYKREKNIKIKSLKDFSWLFLFGFVNTGFHYFCFYMGLSHCSGSKASIIDSLGTFWLIFLAVLFFKERLTSNKILGCLFGFAGIIIANFSTDIISKVSFQGEGFLVISTLCAAFGGVIVRIITTVRNINAVKATGYGLTIGGVVLLAGGLFLGGTLTKVTLKGIVVMFCLVAISVVGFVLYNQLLSCNPVGQIAIFNALIPVFGTLTSCILTGERFYFRYIISIILVALGIWFVNREKN